jgi:hypothetical protein
MKKSRNQNRVAGENLANDGAQVAGSQMQNESN